MAAGTQVENGAWLKVTLLRIAGMFEGKWMSFLGGVIPPSFVCVFAEEKKVVCVLFI